MLREFSPEEVTANIYTMVDVLLHHIHLELQHGHSLQVLYCSSMCVSFVFVFYLFELMNSEAIILEDLTV